MIASRNGLTPDYIGALSLDEEGSAHCFANLYFNFDTNSARY